MSDAPGFFDRFIRRPAPKDASPKPSDANLPTKEVIKPFNPVLARVDDGRNSQEKLGYVFCKEADTLPLSMIFTPDAKLPNGDDTVQFVYFTTDSGNAYELEKGPNRTSFLENARRMLEGGMHGRYNIWTDELAKLELEVGKPFRCTVNRGVGTETPMNTSTITGIVAVSKQPHDEQSLLQLTKGEYTDIPRQFREFKEGDHAQVRLEMAQARQEYREAFEHAVRFMDSSTNITTLEQQGIPVLEGTISSDPERPMLDRDEQAIVVKGLFRGKNVAQVRLSPQRAEVVSQDDKTGFFIDLAKGEVASGYVNPNNDFIVNGEFPAKAELFKPKQVEDLITTLRLMPTLQRAKFTVIK